MLESVFKSAQLSLTFLFLLGMGLYLLDRRPWWQAVYRWIHDFFHAAEKAMPKNEIRGVFHGQPSKVKWTRVGLCSTLLFIIQIWEAKLNVNLAAEVIVWILGLPTMLVGIFIGYQTQEKLFPNKDKVFNWADRTSEQLDHVSLAGAAAAVKETGTKVAGGIGSTLGSVLKKAEPEPAPPAPAAPEPQAGESPMDVIRRFQEGGRNK